MPENLLRFETSPYLLQHKDNPVAWHAWGPDAFAQAQRENKPILLSVGYAACHWCHVMAHESFEDQDTAALMNSLFVNIKVDREERPDVDTIYMSALSLLGQQGGWPLTMFLTPKGEPFWGGTYFPPQPHYGRPAFRQVLSDVATAYQNSSPQVTHNVNALMNVLSKMAKGRGQTSDGFGPQELDTIASRVLATFDPIGGGIGSAPKFPHTPQLELTWRAWLRTRVDEYRGAVIYALTRMSEGGIYDHLGGGFARYSTDAQWLAPHFEKMLYDNAALLELLTLVWTETKVPLLLERAHETVQWCLREMTTENGAFAASLDADSQGEEGRFYVWSAAQIDAAFGPGPGAELFKRAYDVRLRGNWEGKNILNRLHSPALTNENLADLKVARAKLLSLQDFHW
jgi:uncharacterized protein YyaL (SSP411 family)